MPPRVQNVNAAGTGIGAWYNSIPPVTRCYATGLLSVTLGARIGLIPLAQCALIWDLVIKKFHFWRLFANFFYMGKFSLNWIVRFIWLVSYGAIVEGQTFQFEPAGFVFLMLFGMCSMLLVALAAFMLLNMPFYFNGSTMVFMLLYVWSRQFPDQQVSIYGLFKVLSFYVPFVWIGLDFLISGGIPWDSVAGIFIGHMHYYLTELYPAVSGKQLLKTPVFLVNVCADMGLGRRVNTHAATGQSAFSAFRGSGQRLGS